MLNRLLREPLAHFLAIGLLLFLAFKLVGGGNDDANRQVIVDDRVVGALVQQFSGVWQRPPTPVELKGLVDSWVREEVLYREGLKLGLDKDDAVVRRRVRQKVDVLAEESQPSQAPTEAELTVWLGEHADRYALQPVLTFQQAMIDSTQHATDIDVASARMRRELERGADPAAVTESRLLPSVIREMPEDLVARDFGEQFVASLRALPTGSWQGPVQSGFGLHFVKITDRVAGRAAQLDEVRADVTRDMEQDRRERAAQAFFDEALGNYDVRYESAAAGGAGK